MTPADRAWQRIQRVLAEEGVTLEQAMLGQASSREAIARGLTTPAIRVRPELHLVALRMHVDVADFWRSGPDRGTQLDYLTRLNVPRREGRVIVGDPRRVL